MREQTIRGLLIEDNPDDAFLFMDHMAKSPWPAHRFHFQRAATLSAGIEVLSRGGIEIVMLDVMLPDSPGIESVRRLRSMFPSVAVVVLTGLEDESVGLDALRNGAEDYQVKGKFEGHALKRMMSFAVERHRTLARMGNIIDKSVDGMVVIDSKGLVRQMNPAAEALFGAKAEQMLGKPFPHAVPRDRASELRIPSAGGARVAETRVTEIEWDNAPALLVLIRDNTEKVRMLEELRLKTSLLAAQNEASIAGILAVDGAGRVLSATRRFAEMWGIPPEVLATGSDEQMLRSIRALLVHPEEFMARVQRLYAHGDEKARDEIALKDGRTFERHTAPLLGEGGQYYGRVWFFRDITEQRKIAALEAEIKQRRALDALKDQFIGAVSHELRTPLAIVSTAVESLRDGLVGKLTPPQEEIAKLCHRNIRRLGKMLNNLLDISRLEAPDAQARFARLDLRSLVADLEEGFRIMDDGRAVALKIDVPADLPSVRADPEMIREALGNLLDNAKRFAKTGVRLSARRARGPASGRETDGVRVDVSDDGPGIAPDSVGLLFNKFSQVDRAVGGGGYKGTGLGLAICKEIVALHGSEIVLENAPGRGARFRFFLPEWSESLAPAVPPAKSVGP